MCGARTKHCLHCGAYVRLKDMATHREMHVAAMKRQPDDEVVNGCSAFDSFFERVCDEAVLISG